MILTDLLILFFYVIVLVRVAIAVTKHYNQKQRGEERIYSNLQFHVIVHPQRKSGQGLKAGAWR